MMKIPKPDGERQYLELLTNYFLDRKALSLIFFCETYRIYLLDNFSASVNVSFLGSRQFQSQLGYSLSDKATGSVFPAYIFRPFKTVPSMQDDIGFLREAPGTAAACTVDAKW